MTYTNVSPTRLTTSPVALSTNIKQVYTCPASTSIKITAATATNTTSSPTSITVYLVSAGSSPQVANQVVSGQTISANGSYAISELLNHILHPGDSLYGLVPTSGAVNLNISGVAFN